jgi:hypothetical protein
MMDYPGCKHAPLGRDGNEIRFVEVQLSADSAPPIRYQIHQFNLSAWSKYKVLL